MYFLKKLVEILSPKSMWDAVFVTPRRIRSDILFGTLSILFISILLIISYNYYSMSVAIREQTEDNLKSSIEQLERFVSEDFDEAENVVLYYSPLLESIDLMTAHDNGPLLYSITKFLNSKPQITSVYYGTPEGLYVEITSPITAAPKFKKKGMKIPEATTTILNTVDRTKHLPTVNDHWVYVFNHLNKRSETIGGATTYDHRIRGWYVKATKSRIPVWSDPYLFESIIVPEVGISVSQSLYDKNGKFKGVFGADISLDSIEPFLQRAKISNNSKIFILDGKNNLISATAIKDKLSFNRGTYELLNVNNFGDPVLKKASKILTADSDTAHLFHDNREYIAASRILWGEEVDPWRVLVIAPMDDFVTYVIKNRNITFIYSFFILIFAFFLAYGLAKRISTPIIQLAEEANKIQELNFTSKLVLDSRITEINMLFQAMSSLKNTMQSFSSYIPKTLVRKLLHRKQSVHVGGRTKKVTLMFTDIENFTHISESTPPERLIVHLSEYFEELTDIIMDKNGTIDKYIGDAIMSFWGAPIPDKNQVVHACQAALLCQHRLNELSRTWKRSEKPIFNTRIGLHMGDVIIGNIGSSERMNYTAIGDSVNLCSRLESLNKYYGSKIIVSESIYDIVRETFLFRQLDVVAVKGKNKAVRIYELVAQLKDGEDYLLPTDDELEYCKLFNQAYNMFRTRQWTEAQELFSQITPLHSKDYSVNIYIERCKQFAKSPPPKDWDGTVVMQNK